MRTCLNRKIIQCYKCRGAGGWKVYDNLGYTGPSTTSSEPRNRWVQCDYCEGGGGDRRSTVAYTHATTSRPARLGGGGE